jgi:hypothetical protein
MHCPRTDSPVPPRRSKHNQIPPCPDTKVKGRTMRISNTARLDLTFCTQEDNDREFREISSYIEKHPSTTMGDATKSSPFCKSWADALASFPPGQPIPAFCSPKALPCVYHWSGHGHPGPGSRPQSICPSTPPHPGKKGFRWHFDRSGEKWIQY